MTPETKAIQSQIDEAAARGGGRVVVSPGVHRCGTLYLKSGVELHLAEGAELLGGSRPEDYDDAIPADMVYRYGDEHAAPTVTRKAFLFAENAQNVAITGAGTVRIDGPDFFDRTSSLWGLWWAKPPHPRPRMVVMRGCRGIRIEGVAFRDCPLWTMWLRLCEDIDIAGIAIDCEQKMINSDGIDLDGCRRVRVRDSRFRTGDDCIVLRAIRQGGSVGERIVTEDVTVERCALDSPCQGVRVGCPSDDTIRDAVFRDIVFRGRNAIVSKQPRVYLDEGDCGRLRTANIRFENWKIDCWGNPVEILVEPGIALRDFGHFTFRNIKVKAAKPIVVKGSAETPVRGVHFENLRGTIASGSALDVEYTMQFLINDIDFWHTNQQ